MAKKTTKHYPPAYYTYRKKHPTVSIVLSKETKDALDAAKGKMTYPKFLISLFTPNGVFSQFQKQTAQLASEKVSLENEIKKQRAQLASEKVSLENEIKKQRAQLESDRVSLENGIKKQRDQLKSEWISLENVFHEIERFYVPCIKCGKPILFTNTDANWNSEIKPTLQRTFYSWYHINCGT